MNPKIKKWLGMSREELDKVYKDCNKSGTIPQGEMRGTAILAGSPFSKLVAAFARLFAWQGKVFDIVAADSSAGVLVNKVTFFSRHSLGAKVNSENSWMDGRGTIVIDSSKTSFLFAKVRDGIREIEPGIYLGKVWWGKTRILDFALTTKE